MAKNQKSYTPGFKQQIVDLYNAGGKSYPQPEREYDISRSTLSTRVKQLTLPTLADNLQHFHTQYEFCLIHYLDGPYNQGG